MAEYGVELPETPETLTLSDTYSRVWLATPELTETLALTDSSTNAIERLLTETFSLSDGENLPSADKNLTETLTLSDSYSRVWLSAKELTEALALTDTYADVWVLARTYTETLTLSDDLASRAISRTLTETFTLTDGDGTELVMVSPNGGYIAVLSEESTASAAISEVMKLLEEQGAPSSQTSFIMCYNEDNGEYAVAAIVKRH